MKQGMFKMLTFSCLCSSFLRTSVYEHADWIWKRRCLQPSHQLQWKLPATFPWTALHPTTRVSTATQRYDERHLYAVLLMIYWKEPLLAHLATFVWSYVGVGHVFGFMYFFLFLGGFTAFGQGKVTPFGQNMTAPGVTNNPFLVRCVRFYQNCICTISVNYLLASFVMILKTLLSDVHLFLCSLGVKL